VAARGQHRAVEVERHGRQLLGRDAIEHQLAAEGIDGVGFGVSASAQPTRERRHVGQSANAAYARNQRVVGVVVAVAQGAETEQHVHDQLHEQHVRAVRDAARRAEASSQARAQAQRVEEHLEQHQPREARELLLLEPKLRNGVDSRCRLRFAQPHTWCPPRRARKLRLATPPMRREGIVFKGARSDHARVMQLRGESSPERHRTRGRAGRGW
jgi:hypothetical protein